MHNNILEDHIGTSDDAHVLRYLLHNVKGIRPVSGGVMGDTLEAEYALAEAEAHALEELNF